VESVACARPVGLHDGEWAEEARPAGESPVANGRAVHARKAKRRPRRLGERERRNNCAWGSEASHARIGEKRYGVDLARAPGGFPNRRQTRVHTSVTSGANRGGRHFSTAKLSQKLNYGQELVNTKVVEDGPNYNFHIGTFL